MVSANFSTIDQKLLEKGKFELFVGQMPVDRPRNHFIQFETRVPLFPVAFIQHILTIVVAAPPIDGLLKVVELGDRMGVVTVNNEIVDGATQSA